MINETMINVGKINCWMNDIDIFFPNLGKISLFFHVFLQIASILVCKGPKEQVYRGKFLQWPHLYTTYEAKYDLK